jgi:predicted metalloprotease
MIRALPAVLACALVVSGLAVDLTNGSTTPAAAVESGPVRLVADAPGADGATAAARKAVTVVDGFWRRHFAELSSQPYRRPHVVGGYVGTRGPTCAGQPALPFNAFYCPSQDFLAWDENLMNIGYRKVGTAWVYLIIAHEWGHSIQARLNRYQVSVAAELQADCLAGATLTGARRDGLIRTRPGDSQKVGATLTALADTYPWTNQRDHGNSSQRIGSFNLGAERGAQACLAR